MKTTKEWMSCSLVCPRPPAPGHTYKPNDCDKCYEAWVSRIQADAMKEARNVLRKCWDSALKTIEIADYHNLIAYELEHRAKEIEEPSTK